MFDRSRVKKVREEIQEFLDGYAEVTGLGVTLGNASFSDNTITFKLEVAEVDKETGEVFSKIAEDFRQACPRWRMSPEDLGREFEFNGNRFTLIGAKPRSRKYPLIGRRSDGKQYKFSPMSVSLE